MNAIKLFKEKLNYKVAVIKNIHEHEIDKEGKDSYKFAETGTVFSITKNINDETTIFLKLKISIEEIVKWLEKSPFKIDLIFTEGFRDLNYPTILCVKEISEIKKEITKNIKMVSGLIIKNNNYKLSDFRIPILDINKDFQKFLELFEIN